jgi:Transcriptional regulator
MNKTKRAIFDAAIKIFSENGYGEATMDNIALEAGVAKGTLYYHFKSKEEIFKYIITEGMNIITEQVETAVEKQEDIFLKLREICRVQLSLVYQNRDFFKVIMSQLWGHEIRHLELRASIRKYISNIENYLNEAVEEGLVRPMNSSFISFAFFGSLCSTAVYEVVNNSNSDIEILIDDLMKYVLSGIQK